MIDKSKLDRDVSKAIITKDMIALEEYKKQKRRNKLFDSMAERLNILEEKVKELEARINDNF